MKTILSLILGVAFLAFTSPAFADDTTTIYVSQSGDSSAKVCTAHPLGYDSSKSLGTIPVKFADGTSWNDVKRSYDLPSGEASMLANKGACITVHGDGGLSVSCSMCKSKSKK